MYVFAIAGIDNLIEFNTNVGCNYKFHKFLPRKSMDILRNAWLGDKTTRVSVAADTTAPAAAAVLAIRSDQSLVRGIRAIVCSFISYSTIHTLQLHTIVRLPHTKG